MKCTSGMHLLFILAESAGAASQAAQDRHGLLRRVDGGGGIKSTAANAETGEVQNLRNLQGGEPGPLKVGEEYNIRIDQTENSEVFPVSYEDGIESTKKYKIKKLDGASYITCHFVEFDFDEGCEMRVSGKNSFIKSQRYKMTGWGKGGKEDAFWMQHVKEDTLFMEAKCSGGKKVKINARFRIDKCAHGYRPGHEPQGNNRRKAAICGTDDKENAICYQSSHSTEYATSGAVARLLIQGSSLCTGWLASSSNHLVTNEHCISSATAALNTDYEFMAEASSCGSGNCQLCHSGDVVISGATFIQDNAALDYALVQITSENPAGTYGFLEIDDRAAVNGEQIYIPQHPGGRAKEIGIESTHSQNTAGVCQVDLHTQGGCSSGSYNDVAYYCDTEGGSSGSPVLASSSHKVIALHHCRGSETCTQNGADPNRGVPITLVCDEICSLLGHQCTVDGDCDDGDICTTDTCNGGGSCDNAIIPNCCTSDEECNSGTACTEGTCNLGTMRCEYSQISGCNCDGTCDPGEDCNTCPNDCISGGGGAPGCGNGVCEPSNGEDCISCPGDCRSRQSGKPSNRYCCGDGDGENPVDCSDSRCSEGDWSCGTPVDPYCCGDGTCEGAETSCNCAVDCGLKANTETSCTDGVDNDCDGYIDCADTDCFSDSACPTCGQRGDSCTTNSECCSEDGCKHNGRCY